ncbi:C69 family dipeptidase [Helcococcus ovis]|uniref:Dipeptidase n=1 Tax=Helcococcus ovis TaxID=72026 RepID=A0A4R9C4K4_9FIRM|nr:C69 family dipeptidase [Helcococcus ovis]TFF65524.1 C69 family dipeptidase [Helcococcus ovis]TFF67629.1 C69 family dipeptidase [Helcococcus ovis]
MACTTILVGKNASYDGSTLAARNEDSGAGSYENKNFIVVTPEEQPRKYKSVISKVEIELPDNPMRYTAMPNANLKEGIWGAYGVNEKNISMTATETITSNERVLGADPMVKYIPQVGKKGDENYQEEIFGGIGEEDIVTLVLPYIHTARDGVKRLGQILKTYGTYEKNAIAFQDENEIWWLETIGGHHWIAKKVPDDSYVVMPNQLGIDSFDLDDAFGKQEEYMCSEDLREFISENHLDLSFDGKLNPRDAFGSHSDMDHTYNTPRAWIIQRFFNKLSFKWDGENADFKPESNNIPWAQKPDRKITIEDIKYVLSHHFQETPFDSYGKSDDKVLKGKYRPIGINRNNVMGLVQIRPYMPKAFQVIEWMSLGSNVFNAVVPFYANITKTPTYLSNGTDKVSTDNFYWTNRLIAALCDNNFSDTAAYIENYQLDIQSKGHEMIIKYDKMAKSLSSEEEIQNLLETANQEMADYLKSKTDVLLSNVLYVASNNMKNAFSRSDA